MICLTTVRFQIGYLFIRAVREFTILFTLKNFWELLPRRFDRRVFPCHVTSQTTCFISSSDSVLGLRTAPRYLGGSKNLITVGAMPTPWPRLTQSKVWRR